MSEDRIPVWRAKDEPPGPIVSPEDYETKSYIKESAVERLVLKVYRREQYAEWERFKAGCGRGEPLPDTPAEDSEEGQATDTVSADTGVGRSEFVKSEFVKAVRELMDVMRDDCDDMSTHDAWVKVKSLLPAEKTIFHQCEKCPRRTTVFHTGLGWLCGKHSPGALAPKSDAREAAELQFRHATEILFYVMDMVRPHPMGTEALQKLCDEKGILNPYEGTGWPDVAGCG